MQGNLSRKRLPDLIQSLGRERESGILQVSQADVSKRIYFGRGSMVFARSTLHEDRLGEMLVRKGELTRSNLALASNKMRAQHQKLGATLVSLGLMSKLQLASRLEEQVRGIIYSLFTWDEGAFRFEAEPTPAKPETPIDLPTVPIILEGTRLMDDDAVRASLGDVARIVNNSKDPRVIAHYANLTPQEGFVLSRVDGASTFSDIVSISPLEEVETLRCLYGLLASGFLEVGKKSRQVIPSERKRQQPIDSFHQPSPILRAPARKPTPPDPAPASLPPPASLEEDWVREDIDEKHASVASGTYYDWLEIHRTAEPKDVKKAFAKLVKKYHPDRHRPAVAASAGEKLQAILTKVGQAHETLRDPQRRRRYDNSLRTEAPKGEVAAEPAKRPSPKPKPPTPRDRTAEHYFKQAKKYYAQRDFHEAVELMEQAVAIDPKKVRYQCLLAKVMSENPKWRKSAEAHFNAALAIDPFDSESLVGLAELYESVGLVRRAQALYAEAVELDPENAVLRLKLRTPDQH